MRNVWSLARSKTRPCVSRARVIAGPGHGPELEGKVISVHYSVPKLRWWQRSARAYVKNRLEVMQAEDKKVMG